MEKIIWMPCAGLKFTTPPVEKGHVGVIKIDDGSEDYVDTGEWLSRTEASSKYMQIIFSGSHSRCPECSKIYLAAARAYTNTLQS